MKGIILLLATILLTSCEPWPKHCVEAYRVMHQFAEEEKQEHGFELFSIGGSMMDSIKEFSLDLTCHEKMTFSEAKELYMPSLNKFLNMINSSERVRPYLHHYPFTQEDVEYSIVFIEKGGTFFEPPFVANITIIRGKIVGDYFDRNAGLLVIGPVSPL